MNRDTIDGENIDKIRYLGNFLLFMMQSCIMIKVYKNEIS
jgi:hypothetical protein